MTGRILCCAFWLITLQLSAQVSVNTYFVNIPPEKFGLEHCYGQCFDDEGTLWFCSDKGIYNYNGYTVRKWQTQRGQKNAPLDKYPTGLYRDREGIFWISYLNQSGITRFNPRKNKFDHFLYDSTNKASVPDALIVRFKEDDRGNLWALTWGNGIVRIDKRTGACKSYVRDFNNPADTLGILANRVKAMYPLGDHKYLLGFFAGGAPSVTPMVFDPEKESFSSFPVTEFLDKIENPEERAKIHEALRLVHDIYRDKNGNFWFGTYTCVVFLDMKNKTARRVSGIDTKNVWRNLDNARAFIEDDHGRIWISTTSSGIMVVDPDTQEATYIQQEQDRESGLPDNRVGSFSRDPDGNIWLSSGMGGFSVYVPVLQQFPVHPWKRMNLEFSNRSAQQIPVHHFSVRHFDTLMISSQNGISYYNLQSGQHVRTYQPNIHSQVVTDKLNTQYVHYFFERGNHLYMNNADRFTVVDAKTGRNISIQKTGNKRAYHVLSGEDPEMPVIVRAPHYNVLLKYNEQLHTLDTFFVFPEKNGIHSLEKYDKKTWIMRSGKGSFIQFNPETKTYNEYVSTATGRYYFPDSTILSYYIDRNKTIWVSCENGLYTFNPNKGNVRYINPLIGLDSTTTVQAAIMDRKGFLWIASGKSLIRYDPRNGIYKRMNDILQFPLGTFVNNTDMDAAGRLFFTTVRGMLVIDPERVIIPDRSPRIFLTACTVGKREMSRAEITGLLKGNTVFDWNDNFLNFELHTDQLFSPQPHHFYYRLEGLDTAWIDNGSSNQVRYTNLSHGQYTLEIKLINTYGAQSKVFRISFSIAKPFWLTGWFILLSVALAVTLVYLLIKVRERVHRKKQEELEAVIAERTAEVVAKAREIQSQKDIIEVKNKELTDSIYYAQRIQQSILPDAEFIRKHLPQHLIYFRPKDIVSGDFYWFSQQQDSVLWAVVDCTGHGVPGGFMSMLGAGLLNQIVNEELVLQPDQVLNELRHRVMIALKQTGADGESRDGMDISFCRYIPGEKKLQFAGANNALYILRNGNLSDLKADKQPIGIYVGEKKPFSLHEISLEKNDLLYMSSDGYADQFGGDKGKKFKSSSFEKLLLQIASIPLQKQLDTLDQIFVTWKGDYEQLDDVCVMAVKIA